MTWVKKPAMTSITPNKFSQPISQIMNSSHILSCVEEEEQEEELYNLSEVTLGQVLPRPEITLDDEVLVRHGFTITPPPGQTPTLSPDLNQSCSTSRSVSDDELDPQQEEYVPAPPASLIANASLSHRARSMSPGQISFHRLALRQRLADPVARAWRAVSPSAPPAHCM